MRNILVYLFVFHCIFFCTIHDAAANQISDQENWFIGPRIGLSAFTGLVGAEIQYRNVALSFGIPECVGLKYYFSVPKHSWFIGGYFSKWDLTDDETKDGIKYTEQTNTEGGFGGGYRWRWGSGWDLSLSLAIAYGQEELSNTTALRTERFIGIRPGITAGYSF
ncbi:hypothetical protein JCM14469_13580 [Desulfatiferula olefinivorans]